MKKYLTWDAILGVVLFVGCAVVSVAFVHYSYDWADEYTPALKYSMRIIGFIGTIFFPAKFVACVKEVRHDEEMEQLNQDYYNEWNEMYD